MNEKFHEPIFSNRYERNDRNIDIIIDGTASSDGMRYIEVSKLIHDFEIQSIPNPCLSGQPIELESHLFLLKTRLTKVYKSVFILN